MIETIKTKGKDQFCLRQEMATVLPHQWQEKLALKG